MRKPGRPRIDLCVAEMVQQYESGMTAVQVAAIHGCNLHVALHRLREAGVTIRNPAPGRRYVLDVEGMRLQFEAGWSIGRIGRQHYVDPGTAVNRLREIGVYSGRRRQRP